LVSPQSAIPFVALRFDFSPSLIASVLPRRFVVALPSTSSFSAFSSALLPNRRSALRFFTVADGFASAFVVPVAPAGTFVLRMLHGSTHSSFLLRLLTIALGNALVYPLSANLQLLCRSPTIVSALPCSPPVIVCGGALISSVFATFSRGVRAAFCPAAYSRGLVLIWWFVGGSGWSH